jgi:glycosyltransferase involved in cell wall biosynthesis
VADRTRLTVVVPTRNRPAQLTACLAALRADLGPADQLVVVDSASHPPVHDAVRCDQPGASRARNAGWQQARHELVAFIDDDVRVQPGWADALVAAFTDPSVVFVAGAVGVPEGQEHLDRPVAVTTLERPTTITDQTRGTTGATANLAVRRMALEQVGGFDERLGPGTWARAAEDLDLLDRLLCDVGPGRFEPAAAAVHEQWRSRRQLVVLDFGYGLGLGARLVLLWRRGARARARMVLADAVVDGTLRAGARDLRAGYQLGVLCALARLVGTSVGAARAVVAL